MPTQCKGLGTQRWGSRSLCSQRAHGHVRETEKFSQQNQTAQLLNTGEVYVGVSGTKKQQCLTFPVESTGRRLADARVGSPLQSPTSQGPASAGHGVSGVQPLVGLPVVSRRVVLVLLKRKSLERDRRMSGFWGGMAGSKEWEKVLYVLPCTAELHCQ